MHIEFRVRSRKGQFTFEALIHRFSNPDDFHLDPVAFYQQWGKSVPQDPHHEIEIRKPAPDFFKQGLFHVHRSRKDPNRLFICYPKRLATKKDAIRILRTWCLGTVTTIVEGVDLNTILTECNDDHERMEQVVKSRYGIEIEE